MKYFNDLTDVEILGLTDTDIQNYIELDIAVAGIKFVEKPTMEEPVKVNIVPKDVAYQVGDLLFADAETAQKVANLVSYKRCYDTGYNYKFLKPAEETSVDTVKFYTEVQLLQYKDELEVYHKLKGVYDKLKKEYTAYLDSVRGIKSNVLDRVQVCKEEVERIENLKGQYSKYLELANQDSEIAKNFFVKAYSEETYLKVIGEK